MIGASLIKAAVVVVAAIYGAIICADPSVFRFLDGVNLVFHEAGHVLFGLSGEFVGAWGGTLMQLTIPAAVTVYFVYHRQRYAGAITLFWSAQNLVSISVYIKDARARRLPLLGGEEVIHDWSYILGRLNLVQQDQVIGNSVYALGLLLYMVSIALGLYYARDNRA